MKKALSIFCALALAMSLCSCSLLRVAMDAAGAAREAEIGGRAPEGGYKDYWAEIPDGIPRFEYGTYDRRFSSKMSDKESVNYMLDYTGVTKEDIDAYGKELEEAGFDVSTMESDGFYGVMAMPEGSAKFYPSVSADLTVRDGSCSVMISVGKNPEPTDIPPVACGRHPPLNFC